MLANMSEPKGVASKGYIYGIEQGYQRTYCEIHIIGLQGVLIRIFPHKKKGMFTEIHYKGLKPLWHICKTDKHLFIESFVCFKCIDTTRNVNYAISKIVDNCELQITHSDVTFY